MLLKGYRDSVLHIAQVSWYSFRKGAANLGIPQFANVTYILQDRFESITADLAVVEGYFML